MTTQPTTAPRVRRWTPTLETLKDPLWLNEPMRWESPSIVEVGGDLFADPHTSFIERVYRVMSSAGRDRPNVFLVRTAHPDEMAKQLGHVGMRIFADHDWKNHVLRNVLHGVLLRTQADADRMLPALLGCPGRKWVDVVPGEGIDLTDLANGDNALATVDVRPGPDGEPVYRDIAPPLSFIRVRGEAEPINPEWPRSLIKQAKDAGVPVNFAWGDWCPPDDDTPRGVPEVYIDRKGRISRTKDGRYEPGCPCDTMPGQYAMVRVGRARSGCELDGRRYEAWPEVGR